MIYPESVKKNAIPKEKIAGYTYIVLLSIIGILILLLITGTIAGLVRSRNAEPLIRFGNSSQTNQAQLQDDDIRIYSGLERLRMTLADSSILILSIAFPYTANDTAFTEELAARVNDFKIIAIDYFTTLPVDAVQSKVQIDEESAKREILWRFNNSLRLGRIEIIYFHDMMVLETATSQI